MNHILFTNVKINGRDVSENGVTDVMVFTRLSPKVLDAAWRNEGSVSYDDFYPVRGDELQYYLYEPCYLSEREELRARQLARASRPNRGEASGTVAEVQTEDAERCDGSGQCGA